MKNISILGICLLAAISAYSQVNLSNGLLAHYSLNNAVNDISGNGKHGSATSVTYGKNNKGLANSAGVFNGYSSFVQLPDAFDYMDKTLVLWFNATHISSTTRGYIFCSDNPNMNHGNYDISILKENGQNKIWFLVSDGYPNVNGNVRTANFSMNSWHTASIITSGSKVYYYLDCALVDSATNNNITSVAGNSGAILGAARFASNQFFDGMIDEVRLYNRVLNRDELDSICAMLSVSDGQTGITTTENASFTVYPNPANELVYISSTENTIFNCDFIDASGKTLRSYINISQPLNIDISTLPNGIYTLRIKSNNADLYKKIVVSR